MLKRLLKKQLIESFQGFFYDAKKNRKRTKQGIFWSIFFFLFLIFGVFGGTFIALTILLAKPLCDVGMDWFYFALFNGLAIVMGVFGNAFTTYSCLYIGKDNDFLLSLPIPVSRLIISRLLSVYLLGALYALPAILPTCVVYLCVTGFTISKLISEILMTAMITLLVLVLSCLLGWCIARISLKVKNKSFYTVILSLLIIGLYYIAYFKSSEWIKNLLMNPQYYGDKVKGGAGFIYRFGKMGTGDLLASGVGFILMTAVAFLVWLLLKKTFLSIATATGKQAKGKKQKVSEKSVFRTCLNKEMKRFLSSANYLLNCGMGAILAIIAGVALLVKGGELTQALSSVLPFEEGVLVALATAVLGFLAIMIDPAAPSVSLEGKSLWIYRSLPVTTKTILRAKTTQQLILSLPSTVFVAVCMAVVFPCTATEKCLLIAFPIVLSHFLAYFNLTIGIKTANLTWTNEIIPIKQGAAVIIIVLGGMGVMALYGVLTFFVSPFITAEGYILIWMALFAVGAVLSRRWLYTKGIEKFNEL